MQEQFGGTVYLRVTVVLRDLVEAGVAVWSFTTARVFLEVIFIQV